MASTMKKAAKAVAVAEGTFYECAWCGKEGTNTKFSSCKVDSVCGREVITRKLFYCSKNCMLSKMIEDNRRFAIDSIEWANTMIAQFKTHVTQTIKDDDQVDPTMLQIIKIVNILKKVTTLALSGDKPSARKLFEEKKEIITDCAEDVLADADWSDTYIDLLNRIADAKTLLKHDTSL